MQTLSLIAVTPRSAALLIAPPGTKYRLAQPVAWQLETPGGKIAASGTAEVAALFVEALSPAQSYCLRTDLGEISFRTPDCAGCINITDFDAAEDAPDNCAAITAALAAVPEGGTLVVPPGRFVTRPIFMRPDITFYLPSGAELAAPADREGWPILPAYDGNGRVLGTWEGLPEASYASLITAIDCDRLAITGAGTIDAGGQSGDWWTWPKETRSGARRARSLFIAHSSGVSLTGLRVQNSPAWTIHPYRCKDLTASALTIISPSDSPNTDGFNPESCENVALTGLNISVGDDCIAIKAGKRADGQTAHLAPTRDIRISHSRMSFGHGAVVLGSEMSGEITDVTIEDCEFDGTDRGLRLKTRRGRGGCIARVRMERVDMERVATPFVVNAFYFCDADGRSDFVQSRENLPVTETTPRIEDITLRDVAARNVSLAAAAALGLPEAPARSIRIERFSAGFDPGAVADVPLMATGVAPVRHAALIAEFAEIEGEVDVEDAQAC